MPRIKEVILYAVVDDAGNTVQEFRDPEDADDLLQDMLEGIRQVEEDEKQQSENLASHK